MPEALDKFVPERWIIESNKIEDVYDDNAHKAAQEAWEWFRKQQLNLDTILECHGMLYYLFSPVIAGIWRNRSVSVVSGSGSILHTGAPASQVPELMKKWLKEYGKVRTWNQIKKAHVQFEMIHPFIDGNGRVGRMVMNWQRVKAGLEPLVIEAEKRGEYYQWFRRDVKVLKKMVYRPCIVCLENANPDCPVCRGTRLVLSAVK